MRNKEEEKKSQLDKEIYPVGYKWYSGFGFAEICNFWPVLLKLEAEPYHFDPARTGTGTASLL